MQTIIYIELVLYEAESKTSCSSAETPWLRSCFHCEGYGGSSSFHLPHLLSLILLIAPITGRFLVFYKLRDDLTMRILIDLVIRSLLEASALDLWISMKSLKALLLSTIGMNYFISSTFSFVLWKRKRNFIRYCVLFWPKTTNKIGKNFKNYINFLLKYIIYSNNLFKDSYKIIWTIEWILITRKR